MKDMKVGVGREGPEPATGGPGVSGDVDLRALRSPWGLGLSGADTARGRPPGIREGPDGGLPQSAFLPGLLPGAGKAGTPL